MKRALIISTFALFPILALARGGGGGSGGGGGGGGGGGHSSGGVSGMNSFGLGDFLFLVFLMVSALLVAYAVHKKRKLHMMQMEKLVTTAAVADSAWERNALTTRASSLFLAYQDAWCKNDATWIETLCTADFAERTILKMDVLRNMKRKDIMTGTNITEMTFDAVYDDADNTKDLFTLCISASAKDELIDAETNTRLFVENASFTEYWTFNRIGNDWRVAGIRQSTEDLKHTHAAIVTFAEEHRFFYEPDFGWLMLPIKGDLFKNNKLGESDINDHVIGRYRGKIVEFYTMRPYNNSDLWLVAEAILPIKHFDIIIRPKKFFQISPNGMRRHATESNAFDKIFVVDSDLRDNVTTFELLTPDFMQYMIDLPSEMSIEVVGNTLYFATKDIGNVDYKKMLDLLDKAFDAMKM